MRSKIWVLSVVALSLCVVAAAQAPPTFTASPSSITVGNVETFLHLQGTGVLGTDSSVITYTAPDNSQFTVESSTTFDAQVHPGVDDLDVWVPIGVALTPGHYTLTVQATDVGQAPRFLGPASFDVNDQPTGGGGPPQLSLPEVLVGEATTAAGGIVTFDVGTASCSPGSGAFFNMGPTTVSCSDSNAFGTSSATFLVLVTDTTQPVLTVPADIVSANPVVTYSVSATDNIDGSFTNTNGIAPTIDCDSPSGSTFPEGETVVTCTALDKHFNGFTKQFKVTIVVLPTLTLPPDTTAEATGPGGAVVNYVATTSAGATIVCTPPSGSLFPLGTTTVNCTATNPAGSTSGSFHISVVDTTPPAVTVPGNLTKEATGPGGAAVTFTVTANDLVDGAITPTCSPASGSTFGLGTTLVHCTATDAHSNTGSGSFSVTVVDTTPPTITVPADKTVEATSGSGAVVTYTVTANDLVDGAITPTCSPASGSTFPLGTTTVNCTATDAHSNVGHGSFHVTVQDTTPPTIQAIDGSPREVLWPNNHKMQNTTVIVVATDAVDPHPHARIISVTSDQPVNDGGDGDTSPDWLITGDLTVQLRSERSSGVDRHYTITVEVTDFSGNAAHGTLVISVHP